MRISPLSESALEPARRLLERALPHDPVGLVAAEKLFGSDGPRRGLALGAFEGSALAGVLALAGRWIKLFAVEPGACGRGVGSALIAAARERRDPAARLRIFDHPGNYLSPGIDARYQAGLRFLAHRGFRVRGEVQNLRAPLENNPLVTEARRAELVERAAQAGYQLARGDAVDSARLLAFVGRCFSVEWAHEVSRALAGERRAVHVALAGSELVAFAAGDGNNQGLGWFGPAGTLPEHRGRGLGEALLLACLLDMRGQSQAGVIAWIGPRSFYQRCCGAVDDRRFLLLEEERG